MVSSAIYIKKSLGIDINQPIDTQSRNGLLPKIQAKNHSLQQVLPSEYLPALYDAVVGINAESGCRFDVREIGPDRFGTEELKKLAALADAIRRRIGTTQSQIEVLEHISTEAKSYVDFLSGPGGPSVLKRDPSGTRRHTLIRAGAGIYEMQNSMSKHEAFRFCRKTHMLPDAIVKNESIKKEGNLVYKVELGKGGFGKARIARNILSDTYVAVKKSHPTMQASLKSGFSAADPRASNYSSISPEINNALRRIKHSVIFPIDESKHESKQSNRLKDEINSLNSLLKINPRNLRELVPQNKNVQQALNKLDYSELANFLDVFENLDLNKNPVAAKTDYSFSELGLSTIADLIDKLNVIRSYYEGKDSITEVTSKGIELLINYSSRFDEPPSNIRNKDELSTLQAKACKARLSRKNYLTDSAYHQRFINTLGKKMLESLADMHNCNISHQDIKPDNIVITQDLNDKIAVKLIDVDLIKTVTNHRELPEIGCQPYLPSEAVRAECDGSVSYTGFKGDAYAMGLTLRKVCGFGDSECYMLSEMQKRAHIGNQLAEAACYPKPDLAKANADFADFSEAANLVGAIGDNAVQDQSQINAIMHAVPIAVTLKDISDLLLQIHPGRRYKIKDVLECGFFSNHDNFLNNREFSQHALRIHRFGLLIPKHDMPIEPGKLPPLRQAARTAAIKNRGGTPIKNSSVGFSLGERSLVEIEEKKLREEAVARRKHRRFQQAFNLDNPNLKIADLKLQYRIVR